MVYGRTQRKESGRSQRPKRGLCAPCPLGLCDEIPSRCTQCPRHGGRSRNLRNCLRRLRSDSERVQWRGRSRSLVDRVSTDNTAIKTREQPQGCIIQNAEKGELPRSKKEIMGNSPLEPFILRGLLRRCATLYSKRVYRKPTALAAIQALKDRDSAASYLTP